MIFQLGVLGPSDVAQILEDASEIQRHRLSVNKFFARNPDLCWAIDRESGNYLFRGPKIDPRGFSTALYLRFEGHLLEIDVPGYSGTALVVREKERIKDFPRFKAELTAAVSVYGLNGLREEGEPPSLNFGEGV